MSTPSVEQGSERRAFPRPVVHMFRVAGWTPVPEREQGEWEERMRALLGDEFQPHLRPKLATWCYSDWNGGVADDCDELGLTGSDDVPVPEDREPLPKAHPVVHLFQPNSYRRVKAPEEEEKWARAMAAKLDVDVTSLRQRGGVSTVCFCGPIDPCDCDEI